MPGTRQALDRIAVFCGARTGIRPQYVELAKEFGVALARRGVGLVYGAGGVGVMGAVADAAFSGGASVTGVIPHRLYERELPRRSRGEVFVVRTMHERKARMYKLSKGFAVLPGGLGTLDELMEVATWNQLGFHQKPIVLINHEGFFDPLAAMLDHIVKEGFLSPQERSCMDMAIGVEEALDLLGCAPESVAL
ncbi:TIGR00730 family Rossman fold protein [Streptomyces sp. NPDC087218]|uniref:LOG family protein n=1 Tax=Streptomyces sp. NPDC087218 TaxID=3365769 RepID=UPI0038271779